MGDRAIDNYSLFSYHMNLSSWLEFHRDPLQQTILGPNWRTSCEATRACEAASLHNRQGARSAISGHTACARSGLCLGLSSLQVSHTAGQLKEFRISNLSGRFHSELQQLVLGGNQLESFPRTVVSDHTLGPYGPNSAS